GEHRPALLRPEAGLSRDVGDLVGHRLLELPRIDGPVLPGADPGAHDVAEARLLAAPEDAIDAAAPRVVQHRDGPLHEPGQLALRDLGLARLARVHLARHRAAPGTPLETALREHTGEKVIEKSHAVSSVGCEFALRG